MNVYAVSSEQSGLVAIGHTYIWPRVCIIHAYLSTLSRERRREREKDRAIEGYI
jgi:hypothetical protein